MALSFTPFRTALGELVSSPYFRRALLAAVVLPVSLPLLHQFLLRFVDRRIGPRCGRFLKLKDGSVRRIVVHGGDSIVGPAKTNGTVVILVGGLGMHATSWAPFQRALETAISTRAATTLVASVSYDRAGNGWSPAVESASHITTIEEMASELYDVMESLNLVSGNLNRPVILCGHSMAGSIIQARLYQHPALKVNAIVFADPMVSDIDNQMRIGQEKIRNWMEASAAKEVLKLQLGYGRFVAAPKIVSGTSGDEVAARLTLPERFDYAFQELQPEGYALLVNEYRMVGDATNKLMKQREARTKTGQAPFVLIVEADQFENFEQVFEVPDDVYSAMRLKAYNAWGRDLCSGTFGGVWTDKGSTHLQVILRPMLVDAVLKAVDSVRC
ncbi:Alpha/Beta hydrolase protein [Fimicolochytrium jonesii]|uniref:Alpha/Beta hydrolase protein n=1 Tax=Fimicolochytrium jonesii TaxID=1396493 RepID=UPI0022FE3B2A|nr:Alpha/Beta hydrolase protein [Fimicolochytrium jonesii]KAI8818417.1 Alpha/Beta hydrolase protein [Fimicolochytrium jonesii]